MKQITYRLEPITKCSIVGFMNFIKILTLLIFFILIQRDLFAQDFNNFQVIDSTAFADRLNDDLALEHPLYKKIMQEFAHQYEQIGQQQAENALRGKNVFIGGGLNKIGIRYAKDFVDFQVNIERQLAPDLFDDQRWIVKDVFSFEISASKLLSKLSDEGTIEIGQKQFALFAGLKFKRQYTWVHFADSYVDGLTKSFHKLFLPFLAFTDSGVPALPEEEILSKEDFLTFSAGGLGSMPVYGPLWASAGALGSYKKLALVQFHAISDKERIRENEVLRMQVEKTLGVEVGLRASLQIDFLKILRFTLLSYDFSYEYNHSHKAHLSFSAEDLNRIQEVPLLSKEFKKSLRYGEINYKHFKSMILALEDSKKAIKKSRYMVLLAGGMKEQATTHVQIEKDNKVFTFFRHNFEKSFYIENFWSRVMGSVFKSLLGMDSMVNKTLVDMKRVQIEYRSEENLIENLGKLNVNNENFSLLIERTFKSSKLTKLTNKHATNVLETFGGVDPLVWHLLRSGDLKGPLAMSGKYVVKKSGLDYFNSMSYQDAYRTIKEVCRGFFCRLYLEKSYDRYWKELSHSSYDKKLFDTCKPKFKLFKSARKRRYLWESCLQKRTKLEQNVKLASVPLWRLKDFVQRLAEKTQSKVDLYDFFGLSNVFLHGSFQAVDVEGRDFVSYFREGQFDGIGLVDGFLIENGLQRQ